MGEIARLLVRAAPHLWARYKGRIVAAGAGSALLVAGLVTAATHEEPAPPSCYTIVPQAVPDRAVEWSAVFYGSDLEDLEATQQELEERGFELVYYRSGALEDTHYLHMKKHDFIAATETAFRAYQEDLCDVVKRHDLSGTTGPYLAQEELFYQRMLEAQPVWVEGRRY